MPSSSTARQSQTSRRRRSIHQQTSWWALLACISSVAAFAPQPLSRHSTSITGPSTPTALSVWWYGGSESTEASVADADSCELVPVRIERPTSNSRKIFGEITASAPLEDVWSILTDYDRLAIHVPNLKESKITQKLSNGSPGDGQYQCRLFQRGAQKIIGFEFGASVTMDMREYILSEKERKITFKCFDSMFFSEFDGEWSAQERVGANGELETLLSYVVLVKPNGPVPVAALEWRIREDVPTNLRAVKLAATRVRDAKASVLQRAANVPRGRSLLESLSKVQWYKDETMAAYLTEQ